MKTSIIIPAFNEEKLIPLVIGDIPKDIVDDIWQLIMAALINLIKQKEFVKK